MKRLVALILALMLCPCFSLAAETGTQAWAEEIAIAFFSNPYVDEMLNGRTLSLVQEGENWLAQVAASQQQPSLSLLFDGEGRILSYQNSAVHLPEQPQQEMDGELALETIIAIDEMNHQLLNNRGYNQQSIIATETVDEETIHWFSEEMGEAYLAVRLEPEMKVYAFLDLSSPAVRYGSCLSLQQVQDAALAILQTEMGLTVEQLEGMTLTQSELCWGQIDWLNQELPTPFWYLVLSLDGSEADWASGLAGEYGVFLDAQTGERRLTLLPGQMGNG